MISCQDGGSLRRLREHRLRHHSTSGQTEMMNKAFLSASKTIQNFSFFFIREIILVNKSPFLFWWQFHTEIEECLALTMGKLGYPSSLRVSE